MSLLGKEWYGEFIAHKDGFEEGFKAGYEAAKKELEGRKTGKWKKKLLATEPFTIYGYDCPFCKFGTATNGFNFCPKCGAKMEVDE